MAYYTVKSDFLNFNFVEFVPPGPIVVSGFDSLQISGSSTFDVANWGVGGFGAPEYLEAYPMRLDTSTVPWTSYATASSTNPDPPRTGYGTFNYDLFGIGNVVVSNVDPRFWQGTYPLSPWVGGRDAMTGSTEQWITDGYQGASYYGVTTSSRRWKKPIVPSSWIHPSDPEAWIVQFNVEAISFNANANYYAQTLLQDSTNQIGYTVDQNFDSGDAIVIHLIGFGPDFAYDLTLVTNIWLHTNRPVTNQYGSQSLPFKALSPTEALVWLPRGGTWPQYYPDAYGGTHAWDQMNFEFDDSLGNWYTMNAEFNIFTGV